MVEESRAVVVGVDFGTLSGRAVVVRVAHGAELRKGLLT
jgi:L-ribulokinase